MSSQLVIQIVLVVAVAAIGWMMLRSPAGARHQAGRRLATLAFVVLAVAAIATPSLTTRLAHLVGVGRGADLLLYALVVAFLISILSEFRRNTRLERQITQLARRVALDGAPDPGSAPPVTSPAPTTPAAPSTPPS